MLFYLDNEVPDGAGVQQAQQIAESRLSAVDQNPDELEDVAEPAARDEPDDADDDAAKCELTYISAVMFELQVHSSVNFAQFEMLLTIAQCSTVLLLSVRGKHLTYVLQFVTHSKLLQSCCV